MGVSEEIVGFISSTIGILLIIFIICYMYRYRLMKSLRKMVEGDVAPGRPIGWFTNGGYVSYYTT